MNSLAYEVAYEVAYEALTDLRWVTCRISSTGQQ